MKKLNENLYEIATGLYADRRSDGQWYVTDEDEEIQGGPFASLEALAAGWAPPPALSPVMNTTGEPEVVVTQEQAEDLVTLREAAAHLPITRQGLEYRRKKGILGVDPVVTGRSTELYSLKALKAVYPS